MSIIEKVFRKKVKVQNLSEEEQEQRELEFEERYQRAKLLFEKVLEKYNETSCICAHPRFRQMVGIDCMDTANAYKCFDSDLLIKLSKKYFDITFSDRDDEIINEKWVCKKCGSEFEYGWSDLSMTVDRQKLELTKLVPESKGPQVEFPIPVFLGLIGHSYPSKAQMKRVDFDCFEKYLLEELGD